MAYDVFISYSHAGDTLLSERVQDGLSRFAKPWWRRRALNVFRDRASLSANPGLWSSITEAIDDSRYFLMLASPEAAASEWCRREVEYWRDRHGLDGLLVLLTDGEIVWDEAKRDFDWTRTTALGSAFAAYLAEEPLYVDMRWARSELQLDLSDGRFRDQIAELAAPIHGVRKDEIAGADVRQHRRTIRHAFAAGIALLALTIASMVMSIFAVNAAASARRNAKHARIEQHNADVQAALASARRKEADRQRAKAVHNADLAAQRGELARRRARALKTANGDLATANTNLETANSDLATANDNLTTANVNLTRSGLALSKSSLLSAARLAARRSEELITSGDQTTQLGLLLAAEAVRHACASAAIAPDAVFVNLNSYPNAGCTQPGVQLDPSVANSAQLALSNAAGEYTMETLAGTAPHDPSGGQAVDRFDRVAWSSDGQRFANFSLTQTGSPSVAQVWDRGHSPVATATSATGLTFESALSGDGNVLAVTARTPDGSSSVSGWSVASGRRLTLNRPGRRPALSNSGATMAWLAPYQHPTVYVSTGSSSPRHVAVPGVPVAAAVSPDGSLVAAIIHRDADNYALVLIDVATARTSAPIDLGSFANPFRYPWANPPRVRHATADPPAAWFGSSGGVVWAYNNERHVPVRISRTATDLTGRALKPRIAPPQFNLSGLQTSTPDGQALVFVQNTGRDSLLEVSRLSGTGYTTAGLAPLQICSSNPCQLSISPDGGTLTVRSLSALQVVDLRKSAATAASIIPNRRRGTASIVSPAGGSALSWNARAVTLLDIRARSEVAVPIALADRQQIQAAGVSPGGADYVAIIGTTQSCPCRVVVIDASSGRVVRDIKLRAAPFDRRTPAAVALNDATDLVAVTFDTDPTTTSNANRCALVTYSAVSGQPLQAHANARLGIGCHTVSAPAFQPGSDRVALVAQTGSGQVGGVLMDARQGAVRNSLTLSRGAVTLPNSYGNDGYALRFSPNGRLLAWNRGGSVVVWAVDVTPGSRISSRAVLTSSAAFDPYTVAISDAGRVAAVGSNAYRTTANVDYAVVLTGDELGRLLQPLGVAHFVPSPSAGRMSIAIGASGQLVAVTLDLHGDRFYSDEYGSDPGSMLLALCRAASTTITPVQWATYFPDEPYAPACAADSAVPATIDASVPNPPFATAASAPGHLGKAASGLGHSAGTPSSAGPVPLVHRQRERSSADTSASAPLEPEMRSDALARRQAGSRVYGAVNLRPETTTG